MIVIVIIAVIVIVVVIVIVIVIIIVNVNAIVISMSELPFLVPVGFILRVVNIASWLGTFRALLSLVCELFIALVCLSE